MIFLKNNSKNMFFIVMFYLLIFGCSPGPNEGPVPPVEEGQVSTSNIIIGEKEYSYSTRVHDISKEGEEPVLIYLPLKNGDTIENEILELIDSSGIDALTLKDYADNYNISVREFTDIIQATETARKKRDSGYDGTKETFEEVIALFDLLLEYFGDNGVIDLIDTIAVLDLTIEEFNELCKSALGENWPESVSEKFKSWDNMYKNFYISNYSTIDKFLESSISESSHNRQVLAAFLTILKIAKTAAEVFDVAEAFVSEALQLFSPNPKNVPLPNMTTSLIFGEDGKDLKKYAGTRRYNFLTYWYPLALAKRQVIPITLRNEHDGIHDLTIEMESYYGGKRNRPPYTGDDKEKKAKEEAAKDVTWIPLIRVSKTVNQMDQNNCLWRVHNYIPSATIKYSKTWNLKNTNLSTGKDKYFKDAHITIRVLTKRIAFCHIKNHYIHVILRFFNDEPYKTLSWHAK